VWNSRAHHDSGIAIKTVYGATDLKDFDEERQLANRASTLYPRCPAHHVPRSALDHAQYAVSERRGDNQRFKFLLQAGQTVCRAP